MAQTGAEGMTAQCVVPFDPNAGTSSDAHRHQCEVMFVSNLPDKAARRQYLAGVEKFRGKVATARIVDDLKLMVPK